jgi:hypothetical protein
MLRADPMVIEEKRETLAPPLTLPKTDTLDPCRPNPRNEREEPRTSMSHILQAPNRPKPRTDRALPACTCCRIERLPGTHNRVPATLTVLPMRAAPRSEIDDPRARKLHNDGAPPDRTEDRTETVEPIWTCCNADTLQKLPPAIMPTQEILDPTRWNDRIETDEPALR